MNWTEAIAAMRDGKYVTRPRSYTIYCIRKAPTPEGKMVEVIVDQRGYKISRIPPKLRAATDWNIVGVA